MRIYAFIKSTLDNHKRAFILRKSGWSCFHNVKYGIHCSQFDWSINKKIISQSIFSNFWIYNKILPIDFEKLFLDWQDILHKLTNIAYAGEIF